MLGERGIVHAGWLPNHRVPAAFSRARVTVHVPRRPYTKSLPGIPTIRVFEALACGIPLVSSPWSDDEGLFPAGAYLSARDEDEMSAALRLVLHDRELAQDLIDTGLRAIQERHTCAHRVRELLAIVETLRRSQAAAKRPATVIAQADAP
jgi:spore maturation protein CgeB